MLLFRLAFQFGCTVAELQDRMGSAEFADWCAFWRLEPWGFEIDNWRSAMIASTVANSNRPPKAKPYKIADFMPKQARPQTPEEMIAILVRQFGG